MLIHLKDFALTENFGPVTIGMQKEVVLQHLGEPAGAANFGMGKTAIIYGHYEFFFDKDLLDAIQNDSYYSQDPGSYEYKVKFLRLILGFMRSPKELKYRDVHYHLSTECISFRTIDYCFRQAIVLDSGVIIDFENPDITPELEKRKLEDLGTGPMRDHETSEEKSVDTSEEQDLPLTSAEEGGRSLIVALIGFGSFLFYATVLPDAKPWIGITLFVLTTSIAAMLLLKISLGRILKAFLESQPPIG